MIWSGLGMLEDPIHWLLALDGSSRFHYENEISIFRSMPI